MKKILYLLLFLSTGSYACEVTKEYRDARSLIRQNSQYAYKSCWHSVKDFHYWQEVAACQKEGMGDGVAGGCQHLFSYSKAGESKYDDSHCDIFKVSIEEMKELLEMYVKEKNIVKCKN